MALKATIYKATVNVADLDRNQFLDASLTLARHPSETQERMMLRLLAWLKYADERLQFTRGLCADDEPEAWLRNDHLGIDLWIELGLPDERRIKKACTLSLIHISEPTRLGMISYAVFCLKKKKRTQKKKDKEVVTGRDKTGLEV